MIDNPVEAMSAAMEEGHTWRVSFVHVQYSTGLNRYCASFIKIHMNKFIHELIAGDFCFFIGIHEN